MNIALFISKAIAKLMLGIMILSLLGLGIVAIHYFHLVDALIAGGIGGVFLRIAYLIGNSIIGKPNDEDNHGV